MRLDKHFCILALTICAVIGPVGVGFAHEGHDKAPGEDASGSTSGPITITTEARTNLNLTVEEAAVDTVEHTLPVIGQIEGIPSRSAAVTSRIAGRVTALFVTEGQNIKKGQPLVEVESRQPGEPPPRVQYASPIEGVIVDRHAGLGDTVEPDKHLLEVVDLNEVYAEGHVFEGQIPFVKVGQKARVVVESYPGKVFSGTIELVAGELDSASRTLRVWIRIANPDHVLRPNMRATLNIVTGEAESTIVVPNSAILGDAGHPFVFVQSDTNELEFVRRNVVTGISDDQRTEIVEGVFPGDKVVTMGNYQLQYVTTKTVPEKKEDSAKHADAPHGSTISWTTLLLVTLLSFLGGAGLVMTLSRRRATSTHESN